MPIRPAMRVRYPADWTLRSRFVRFVRARNRCEWCGVANGAVIHPLRCCAEPVIGDGVPSCLSCWRRLPRVVLTTAHVHDHRPEAASLLNLAALCQRCHLRHDRRRHAATRRATRAAGQGGLFA